MKHDNNYQQLNWFIKKVQFVVKYVRSGQGLFFQEEHLLNLFESLVMKQCFST